MCTWFDGPGTQDVARLEELYAGLRPLDDAFAYLRKPVAERRLNAATAEQAFDLVTAHQGVGGEACEWVEQHARSITARTFEFASLDRCGPAPRGHILDGEVSLSPCKGRGLMAAASGLG
ncbi:hypothetical protein [Streptomyces goshikiensis]|uniref:hypothetical protein n=1 Tax=Streptomyces goshikiensis TaxID=1942 RepID=UPI0036561C7C